jgi:tRNA-dihydrouridine synthase
LLNATGPEQVERTVAFAKMLEAAGVAALAVHGRRREQRMHQGTVDYDSIAAVKAALSIPVIANGNVVTTQRLTRAKAKRKRRVAERDD